MKKITILMLLLLFLTPTFAGAADNPATFFVPNLGTPTFTDERAQIMPLIYQDPAYELLPGGYFYQAHLIEEAIDGMSAEDMEFLFSEILLFTYDISEFPQATGGRRQGNEPMRGYLIQLDGYTDNNDPILNVVWESALDTAGFEVNYESHVGIGLIDARYSQVIWQKRNVTFNVIDGELENTAIAEGSEVNITRQEITPLVAPASFLYQGGPDIDTSYLAIVKVFIDANDWELGQWQEYPLAEGSLKVAYVQDFSSPTDEASFKFDGFTKENQVQE